MTRREFIALIGGAAAWPLAAGAQQQALPVVGFLSPGSQGALGHLVAAFRRGLNETGYFEHRNVGIEYLWAEGQNDRLPALADRTSYTAHSDSGAVARLIRRCSISVRAS